MGRDAYLSTQDRKHNGVTAPGPPSEQESRGAPAA